MTVLRENWLVFKLDESFYSACLEAVVYLLVDLHICLHHRVKKSLHRDRLLTDHLLLYA